MKFPAFFKKLSSMPGKPSANSTEKDWLLLSNKLAHATAVIPVPIPKSTYEETERLYGISRARRCAIASSLGFFFRRYAFSVCDVMLLFACFLFACFGIPVCLHGPSSAFALTLLGPFWGGGSSSRRPDMNPTPSRSLQESRIFEEGRITRSPRA